MSILQSILLGIVQGITEFLPISSSGHLVLVPRLLGWQLDPEAAFIFDVLVQVATLLAVFAYFWSDLVRIGRAWIAALVRGQPFADSDARLGWYLILASIPPGVIGLLLKDMVEQAFASLAATGLALWLTAGLLILAERAGKRIRTTETMTWRDALWIGFFEALAIFPGVSRSGATIAGGMTRDYERPAAARFSFLMSIPIMLAAGALAGLDLMAMPDFGSLLPTFIPGFIAAAATGYISIRWLLSYLTRRPLTIFAVYCAIAGTIAVLLSVFG
ncbi:MAG TPA: undecaprenyl-diphosphatase UppP [Anaerolineales bacterium]|nr:undecaprenyl-diphosphatase UppP [Anaerolineales bacterium]